MRRLEKTIGVLAVFVPIFCFLVVSYGASQNAFIWSSTILIPVSAALTYFLFFREAISESTDTNEVKPTFEADLSLTHREQLIVGLKEIYQQGSSFEVLMSYIKSIKDLVKHGISFASLEEAIMQISGRKHNRVYLFLDRPLNTEGIFFEYLCKLISRNTTVVMYTSKDYVFKAKIIENKLIKAVGEKAVRTFFEYPSAPKDVYLLINCIIIDPRSELQKVYFALRGQDRKSIVAIELPRSEATDEIVNRAEEILYSDIKIARNIKFPGGAA